MFLTLYKAGFEKLLPSLVLVSPGAGWSFSLAYRNGLGAGGRNKEFYSFPKPLCSQWRDCQPWEPLLSSWAKQGNTKGILNSSAYENWLSCGFPRLPCTTELLVLLLVSCSHAWITSRDVTLQWRDENGPQPTWLGELKKSAPGSLLLSPESYNVNKSCCFMILLLN